MDNINLGGDPPKNQQAKDSLLPNVTPLSSNLKNPANPSDISINFTPTIPETPNQQAGLVSLEVKRADLKKIDIDSDNHLPNQVSPVVESKSLFKALFGKKEPTVTKPSLAWEGTLDASKEIKQEDKAIENKVTPTNIVDSNAAATNTPSPKIDQPKMEFFSSSSLQEKAGTSNQIIENIAAQKNKLAQPKIEELLGKRSTILEKSIEEETQLNLKKKLRLMQMVAFFVIIGILSVNGFLYYQLSPGINLLGYLNYNFENNLRNDLFNLNQNLHSVQTDLNKNRYLSGQLYLNQFGYESTRFIDGVAQLAQSNNQEKKIEIESTVEEAKNHLPDLLAGAKDNLTQSIVVNTFKSRGEEQLDELSEQSQFQMDLRIAISNEKNAIRDAGKQNDLGVQDDDLSFFDNALKLVGNAKLMANLKASTVEAFKADADTYVKDNDAAQKLAFKQYIDNLLASTKVNLATITNLRSNRVTWSKVLDRIEKITNDVNTQHNSGLSAQNDSIINYSGFEFNTDTGKVTINGVNTTKQSTNREVITFLIEAFEASPEFKNVSNRSFPLSKTTDGSGSTTYTMNFKIDMEIEKGSFSKLNKPVADLQAQAVANTKVPVKK